MKAFEGVKWHDVRPASSYLLERVVGRRLVFGGDGVAPIGEEAETDRDSGDWRRVMDSWQIARQQCENERMNFVSGGVVRCVVRDLGFEAAGQRTPRSTSGSRQAGSR